MPKRPKRTTQIEYQKLQTPKVVQNYMLVDKFAPVSTVFWT